MKELIKQQIKEQMEATFELEVQKAFENNPMKGTPFEGMTVYSAIGTTAGVFKETFIEAKDTFGLTEKEVDELVDEV